MKLPAMYRFENYRLNEPFVFEITLKTEIHRQQEDISCSYSSAEANFKRSELS